MRKKPGRLLSFFPGILILAAAPRAWAAPKLDLDADLGLGFYSFKDLGLTSPASNDQSYFEHDMRMGVTLSKIPLDDTETETLELGFSFSAYGIGGSTVPPVSPFAEAAQRLPTTGLSPFLSSAYASVHKAWGGNWTFTVGRVPYRLGSGLLLSDDDVGFAGAVAHREFAGDKAIDFFFFEPYDQPGVGGSIALFGASLKALGADGNWDFNELYEDDHATTEDLGRPISAANRGFSSIHYAMKSDIVSFDGEAAVEYGSALSAQAGTPNVAFKGNAFAIKASWAQPIGKNTSGEGHFYIGRGSGADPGSPNTDGAFFPSFGHRFDGLQRTGVGDLFAATPYDALPSSGSASGLPDGVSGIQYYGLGMSLPYSDILFDLSYYGFAAQRTLTGTQDLGTEIDLSARFKIREQVHFKLSMAFFSAGDALNPVKPSAQRLAAMMDAHF